MDELSADVQRLLGREGVQSDILLETLVIPSPSLNVTDTLPDSFINTTTGWINLLLLSSSRLVKIPVSAGE